MKTIGFALPAGVQVDNVSLVTVGSLSFETWLELGEALKLCEGSVQFWIGDYLNMGESKFGEKYAQAVDAQQASTWAHYAWVCRAVKTCSREHELSYKHHEAVAPLASAEQTQWLKLAVENRWSVKSFREQIKSAKLLMREAISSHLNGTQEPGSISPQPPAIEHVTSCAVCNGPEAQILVCIHCAAIIKGVLENDIHSGKCDIDSVDSGLQAPDTDSESAIGNKFKSEHDK